VPFSVYAPRDEHFATCQVFRIKLTIKEITEITEKFGARTLRPALEI